MTTPQVDEPVVVFILYADLAERSHCTCRDQCEERNLGFLWTGHWDEADMSLAFPREEPAIG